MSVQALASPDFPATLATTLKSVPQLAATKDVLR